MQPYIDEHMAIIMAERNGRSDDWVMKQHKQRLTSWLKDQNIQPRETIDSITISRLAAGPSKQVTSWNAYDINGYTYYTDTKDRKMPTLCHIRFLFIDQWSNMISSLKLYKIYFLDFTLLTSLLT